MDKYNLVFTEAGVEALVTPEDGAEADTTATRFAFLKRLASALQQFDDTIKDMQDQ